MSEHHERAGEPQHVLSRRGFITTLGGAAFAAMFLIACGEEDEGPSGSATTSTPAAGGAAATSTAEGAPTTRIVKHAKGETEVPANPQRLIMLESTITNMMALGVLPVAARNIGRDRRIHPEFAEQIDAMVDFGGQDLDMELVIKLEPDLIIANSPGNDDIYEALTRIAPTVLYDTSGFVDASAEWRDRLRFYGEVVNRQQAAEDLIAAYEARAQDFQTRMGDRVDQTLVSVIRSTNNGINLCTKGGFLGAVLQDAGVRRPPSQDFDAEQTKAQNGGGDAGVIEISLERLRDADGDVIFLWDNPSPAPKGDDEQTQAVRARSEALQADPLWRQLDAVQNGTFYEVGGHWRGFSVLEANMILDDLYRGVLGEPA